MPLSVVTASGPGTKSIFEKMNPFVEKIVGIYNQSQQNKWDNEWMSSAITDIENASNNQTTDLMSRINPPDDYIDTEGVKQFADSAMSMLMKKEVMTGGLTPTAATTTEKPQTEIVPDKMEFNDLYKFVSELPTGKVDWTNTLGVFKKRLEGKRAIGSAAQSFLNQILGQSMPTDQRAKFEDDFKFSKEIQDVLYPESEQEATGEVFDPNQFLGANPGMEVTGYNSNTGGYSFGKKQEGKDTPELDLDKLNKFLSDNNMKLKSVSANPTTGNLSYSFGIDEPKTPIDAKPTWEGNLSKANEFVKTNPDFEITGTNPDSGSVTVSKISTSTTTDKTRANVDKILFGSTGIIPKFVQAMDIDIEGKIDPENEELIRKNFKLKEPSLTDDELEATLTYFKQIDFDPYYEEIIGDTDDTDDTDEVVKTNALGDLWKKITTPSGEIPAYQSKDKDAYGYVLDEVRAINGKKYQYKGNDQWKPL